MSRDLSLRRQHMVAMVGVYYFISGNDIIVIFILRPFMVSEAKSRWAVLKCSFLDMDGIIFSPADLQFVCVGDWREPLLDARPAAEPSLQQSGHLVRCLFTIHSLSTVHTPHLSNVHFHAHLESTIFILACGVVWFALMSIHMRVRFLVSYSRIPNWDQQITYCVEKVHFAFN